MPLSTRKAATAQTPEQLHAERLRSVPGEEDCYLAHLGGCDGRIQAAHYPIPKTVLKSKADRLGFPADLLVADHRNGLRLCAQHHHLVDHGFIVLAFEDLPVRFGRFLADYDCEWLFAQIYDRRLRHASRRGNPPGDTRPPAWHGWA